MLTVSIIVLAKLKGRLARALDSALKQDHADVEVVLVAREPGLDASALLKGRDAKVVPADTPRTRAEAANAGVAASAGEWLCFLDDECWLDASHVKSLLDHTRTAKGHLVVCKHSRESGERNALLSNAGYWRQRLTERMPARLGGMMFSRTLFDAHGCRFDADFQVLDDWDFLLQCAEHSDFIHAVGSTSSYEPPGRAPAEKHLKAAHARLQEKWAARYEEIVMLARSAGEQAGEAIRRGTPDEAMPPVLAALQLDPGNPLLLNQLAWCLGRKKDLPGALRAMRRACDSDPSSMRLLGERVLLEHRTGNTRQARQCFLQLVEQSGTDAEWKRMKAIGAFIGAEIDES